ncbi:MAG: four helix bundle protein [Candidatus Omnitrophica bacterium]|nr:four helix bundle protein [Candidatus Omnitrophota bacterium]
MEKGTVKTFKDLIVWQKAHALTLAIYRVTKTFPQDEKFGIISQLRRSASSIATNIVEGHKRNGRKDFLHFLNLADASLEETKYHLILSRDLAYLNESDFEQLNLKCEEVGRILYGFQKSLKASSYRLTRTA